jgi:hypothetical protein
VTTGLAPQTFDSISLVRESPRYSAGEPLRAAFNRARGEVLRTRGPELADFPHRLNFLVRQHLPRADKWSLAVNLETTSYFLAGKRRRRHEDESRLRRRQQKAWEALPYEERVRRVVQDLERIDDKLAHYTQRFQDRRRLTVDQRLDELAFLARRRGGRVGVIEAATYLKMQLPAFRALIRRHGASHGLCFHGRSGFVWLHQPNTAPSSISVSTPQHRVRANVTGTHNCSLSKFKPIKSIKPVGQFSTVHETAHHVLEPGDKGLKESESKVTGTVNEPESVPRQRVPTVAELLALLTRSSQRREPYVAAT